MDAEWLKLIVAIVGAGGVTSLVTAWFTGRVAAAKLKVDAVETQERLRMESEERLRTFITDLNDGKQTAILTVLERLTAVQEGQSKQLDKQTIIFEMFSKQLDKQTVIFEKQAEQLVKLVSRDEMGNSPKGD